MTQVFLIIVISLSGILAVIVMIKKINKKLSAIDHVPPLTLSHREH